LFDLVRDVEVIAPVRRFKPEVFGQTFHRWSSSFSLPSLNRRRYQITDFARAVAHLAGRE
jgi:hypothetical protein